jgi:spore maturation protein CgeB
MYKDFDDCAEKIKYYLEKEEKRQSIAQKGYEWFHHSFNYRHFWRDFLEAVAIKDYQQINLIGESGLPSQYRIG